jgi:UDP-GlcNAc:undecaprenyl-phosphate/decaprenyl-phosphate GlcNAc-1-phosphate transferase
VNSAGGAALVCGVIVLATEPVTIPLLRRLSIIDVPGRRSSHAAPTPRGGGAPVAVGLLVSAALAGRAGQLPYIVAVGFFGALGFADDVRELPVLFRLTVQGAGAAAVAGLLVAPLGLAPASQAALAMLAALWVAGFVNAFNFMDGVNGISAGHAVIAGVAYACLGEWRPDPFLVMAGSAVAAAGLAFLPWNLLRARVFLGDVGSYSLGAAIAVLAAAAIGRGIPAEAALGPVALYLADTAWTLQRRVRSGARYFEGHRTHTYQRWCDVGWSHQEVTLLTVAASTLLTLLGAASLTGNLTLRLAADAAALGLLATYLRSPVLFWHPDAVPPGRHRRGQVPTGAG